MPPFIPQTRRYSTTPPSDLPTLRSATKPKPSLFDAVDKPGASASLQDNKAFLEQLHGLASDSALSDVSSDDFEDVVSFASLKNRRVDHDKENNDGVDWEDAMQADAPISARSGPEPSGDLELTLDDGNRTKHSVSFDKKKGPGKVERQRRVAAHCLHVHFLLFHNLVRSGWACDKDVQSLLVGQLPTNVKTEVERWRIASGMAPAETAAPPSARQRRNGKKAVQSMRSQRDWGKPAERQEKGAPNMSRGDPLIRILKILAAYWKKRFTITAPALRKQGYKHPAMLAEEIASFGKDKHNPEDHGERVRNIQDFRELARKCEGSRDIGAQLFTALIRGLGLEARLVASLQPVGFGWSKGEEASARRKRSIKGGGIDDEEESVREVELKPDTEPTQGKSSGSAKEPHRRKHRSRGVKDAPIDLSEDPRDDSRHGDESDDDASVVDVTPTTPRKRPNMNYDRDMVFPTYWTEVVSPITNEVYPVDPLVLNPAVATNAELLTSFESRGAKADKAKQVFAYVVGFNADGTAKDVTTRYLKRHIWPGRTKGVRMPVEKVPIYNHRGKIKRHEDYDWFKTVMSGYNRTNDMRTIVDDLEEAKDLKVVKSEKKDTKVNDDSLQGYKTSAEYVLERHLRREEALRPDAKPVKTFVSGKGDKAVEENVYLRKHVEVCRTGESWHKEGRAVKAGELSMKMVPVRAVTLTRKREVEEAERDSGEKPKQGLYAWDQTDWIIPPPIEHGVIPKNAFGNMDCYVPTMVPKGAVHIPLRSTVRVCKKLGIDYAEAVTGFEFGNKRAVPVITGVVVAEENKDAVMDVWKKEEEERRIKEEGKREKMALATWRKWLMGLRIIQRVREEYGGGADDEAHKEETNPFTNPSRAKRNQQINAERDNDQDHDNFSDDDEDMGGGFIAADAIESGGFFPSGHDDQKVKAPNPEEMLLIEDGQPSVKSETLALPKLACQSDDSDSEHPSTGNMDQRPTRRKPGPKPKISVVVSTKPTPKASSTSTTTITTTTTTRNKASANSKKRKASPSVSGSEHDNDAPRVSATKKNTRVAPKRKAARKSEVVVKSHYFDHGSDEEESGNVEVSTSEGEDVRVKSGARKVKRKKGALGARKSV